MSVDVVSLGTLSDQISYQVLISQDERNCDVIIRKERKQFVLAFENVFRRFNGVKLAAAAASDCFIVFDFITRQ